MGPPLHDPLAQREITCTSTVVEAALTSTNGTLSQRAAQLSRAQRTDYV
jgi:hypothetical protein